MKDSAFLCAIAISLAFSVAASAGTVTYLFTTTGSGTIGADSFTDALATVTAVGDTSSIFIWQPGIYVVVRLSSALTLLEWARQALLEREFSADPATFSIIRAAQPPDSVHRRTETTFLIWPSQATL